MSALQIAFAWGLAGLALAATATSNVARPIHHDATNAQAYSLPFSNIGLAELREFTQGNRLFNLRWSAAPASTPDFDGLGPTFAERSCSACHLRDGRGRTPDVDGAARALPVIKLTARRPADRRWLERSFGSELQLSAIPDAAPEAVLRVQWRAAERIEIGGRAIDLRRPTWKIESARFRGLGRRAHLDTLVAPAVFGLGLIENIPEATLLALQDPDDRDGDGISGRANVDARGLGRFGWKASTVALRDQVALAAHADMGLTSSIHPAENCPERQRDCRTLRHASPDLADRGLLALEAYLRLLAVPAPRTERSAAAVRGRGRFREFGCAACHVETLRTGTTSAHAVLNDQLIAPYSDFLLHDLGAGLADHRTERVAQPSEWRTAPLWGLGLQRTVNGHLRLLHDGRAEGFEEAILWHDGEARTSRERFRSADASARDELLHFLESL